MRKTPWLKDMQSKLNNCAKALDTLILIKLDTQSLRQSHDIDTLDERVRDLALRIERGRITTDRLLANQTFQILDHFDRKFDDREREREIDLARQRFIDSLFFPEIEAREDEIVDAFQGTCQWIFDPPLIEGTGTRKWHNFREWLEAGQGVYWISGKPGAGKSTLMKYIVSEPRTAQYLSTWEPSSNLIVATFFLKNFGTELQKNATGLLRSLIMQITRSWPEMMSLTLARYGNATGPPSAQHLLARLPTWTEKQLRLILTHFINSKPATVSLCAFVDGLDEYTGDEEVLLDLISLLSSAAGCKVCVSSRPDQAFRREFQNNPQCRVQDLNEKDIKKMVVEKLKPCLEKDKPFETEAIDMLVDELIFKAEGVFLWSSIMIKDLAKASRNCDSMEELHQRLRETPDTIRGLYRRIIDGYDSYHRPYAFKIFQILIAAPSYEPKVSLLTLACAEDTSWEHVKNLDRSYFLSSSFSLTCRELCSRLRSRCGNIIEVQDIEDGVNPTIAMQSGRHVDFIHRSAVEFLITEYQATFSRDSCLSSTWVEIARANIASLYLFPLTEPSMSQYELLADADSGEQGSDAYEDAIRGSRSWHWMEVESGLHDVIRSGMLVICDEERVVGNTGPRHVDNVQTELIYQMWQTIRWLARKSIVDSDMSTKPIPMTSILQPIGSDAMRYVQDTQDIFRRPWVFAAYWGCSSYVRSYLSAGVLDDYIGDMLTSVLLGSGNPRSELFEDNSPLAYLLALARAMHLRDIISSVCDLLRSQGAVSRRRYRFWGCDDIYYRLNISQSMQLDKALRSYGRFDGLYVHELDMKTEDGNINTEYGNINTEDGNISDVLEPIFQDVLSTNDQLDWDTLDMEWKNGYSDWLEEYHEGETDTGQESRLAAAEI
ncbi:MAG: hypothetical protein Q9169_005177 [Polycauliona sp. 2 TL-2023]